jgi:hypothetical protein
MLKWEKGMKTVAFYWSETGDITVRKIIDEWCLRTGF